MGSPKVAPCHTGMQRQACAHAGCTTESPHEAGFLLSETSDCLNRLKHLSARHSGKAARGWPGSASAGRHQMTTGTAVIHARPHLITTAEPDEPGSHW